MSAFGAYVMASAYVRSDKAIDARLSCAHISKQSLSVLLGSRLALLEDAACRLFRIDVMFFTSRCDDCNTVFRALML